jgi:hypothetical protein
MPRPPGSDKTAACNISDAAKPTDRPVDDTCPKPARGVEILAVVSFMLLEYGRDAGCKMRAADRRNDTGMVSIPIAIHKVQSTVRRVKLEIGQYLNNHRHKGG